MQGAENRHVQADKATDFEAITGKGVTAMVGGQRVALGNAALMKDLDVDIGSGRNASQEMQRAGQTAMFVAIDGQLAGVLGVADPIKATTPDAMRRLGMNARFTIFTPGSTAGVPLDVIGSLAAPPDDTDDEARADGPANSRQDASKVPEIERANGGQNGQAKLEDRQPAAGPQHSE